MRPLQPAQLFAVLALFIHVARAEVVERRINLMGSYGLGGQAARLEHDWIYLKPLFAPAPVGYRPTLGLYAGWVFDEGVMTDAPSHRIAFGASTKIWGLPDHQGANLYFGTWFGATYAFAGEADMGFGKDHHWVDFGLLAGGHLAPVFGLHPTIEVFLDPLHTLMGASAGVSIPFSPKPPLPPPPSPSENSRPLFHFSMGGVFTAEGLVPPLSGEKWFGGHAEAGLSLIRSPRRQLIFGTRVNSAGAGPNYGLDESRPGWVAVGLTLAYQDLQIPEAGMGYRVTAGGWTYSRYRDERGDREDLLPILAVAILVPTRSGFYPFLEYRVLPGPVILGIGKSL